MRRLTNEERDTVSKNYGLVGKYLSQLYRACPSLRDDHDDLFQAGVEGLMRAVTEYDPKRGTKLSTYAWAWIRIRVKEAAYRVRAHVYYRAAKVGFVDVPRGEMPEDIEAPPDEHLDAAFDQRAAGEILEHTRMHYARENPPVYGNQTTKVARDIEAFRRVVVEGESYTEVAGVLGVSRERVRQIVARVRPSFDRVVAEVLEEAA